MEAECLNCRSLEEVTIEESVLWGEKKEVLKCSNCGSVYTKDDKYHWIPVVTTNERAKSKRRLS